MSDMTQLVIALLVSFLLDQFLKPCSSAQHAWKTSEINPHLLDASNV